MSVRTLWRSSASLKHEWTLQARAAGIAEPEQAAALAASYEKTHGRKAATVVLFSDTRSPYQAAAYYQQSPQTMSLSNGWGWLDMIPANHRAAVCGALAALK